LDNGFFDEKWRFFVFFWKKASKSSQKNASFVQKWFDSEEK